MTRLPEHWEDDVGRISRQASARARRGGLAALTWAQTVDAAAGGIIEYLAEQGWPADEHELFLAAWSAITREARESGKHLRHWSFWHEPPGEPDPIGETVSDRVGIHQITWALTDLEWRVVWTLADELARGGTWHAAAARLGMRPGAYRMRLSVARRKARELWVAPGETPRGHWARGGTWDTTRNTRMAGRLRRRERDRRKAAA